MTKLVYLVEAQSGLVKIGVSRNPKSREVLINRHSPIPARLISFWPGDGRDEHALHRRFAGQRSHNEWFRLEGPLSEFVDAKRGLGVDRIPTWEEMTEPGAARRRLSYRERMSAAAKARWANPVWRASINRPSRKSVAIESPAPSTHGEAA